MSGIKNSSTSDPIAQVGVYIDTLRKQHILGKLIFILSLALTADLIYDFVTVAVFNLLGFKMSVPFLFEILLVVLLVREIPKWKTGYLASFYDNRFLLKDRLYSYVWYSRNTLVPEHIRRAQANESLSSIDFSHILDLTRVRFPYYLSAVFLITGAMLYLTWNAEYRPSGITTRIFTSSPGPDHPHGNPVSDSDFINRDADPVLPPLQIDGENANLLSSTSGTPENPDREQGANNASDVAQLEKDAVPGESTASGGSSGKGQTGGGGLPGTTEPPETITSIFESATVSEPIPPLLRSSSSYAFQELPGATSFLSLIPDQGDGSLASLDQETISNFEAGIERFPDRYRDQLQTYYWELKKWNKNP